MDVHDIHLPNHHQEIVDRFLAACRADDRIVAAFLSGSYAEGRADRFSDLDLFFITTDEGYPEVVAERERFVRQLGEPLFLDGFGLTHGFCFIFANGTEGDIWFGRESAFKHLHSGPYRVLLDKKGILAGQEFPAPVANQAEQIELLRQQIDWFWHDLAHFIKAMGRRQLWFAYGEIEVLRQICVVLARLRYDFTDPYAGGGEPYFKIEHALPVEELSPLQTTFCAMEYDAMVQAALVLCRFYQDVAPSLAETYHLTYQTDLERMMIGQLEALGNEGDP